MEPIELFARKKTELSPALKEANYHGACLVAAHQYLCATEGVGYLDENGKPFAGQYDNFVYLGKALIAFLKYNPHA
jgi:hypothetical protein